MNTKIKILFILLSCLYFPHFSEAAWYGDHWIAFGSPTTNCDLDSQLDAIGPSSGVDAGVSYAAPNYASSDGFANYLIQARARGISGSTILCQYWDSTKPTASTLLYAPSTSSGWQNSTTINLTWNASDTGGAGLKNYDIRVYRIAGAQGTPVALLTTLSNVATGATTYGYTGIDGYAYKFEICPRDNALNVCTSWTTSTDIVRIDTVAPNSANLTNTVSANLLATNSQAFLFNFNDGGAPVALRSQIENSNNPSAWIIVFNPSGYAYSQTSNQDIHVVDGSDRIMDTNTARQYTYQVTQICDQAGNCWNGTRDYNYNVYANPNASATSVPDASGLVGAVADGQARSFVQTIKDGYGNAIIPASGISRTVSMNLSGVSNTMYLNQYLRTGATSVFINNNATPLPAAGLNLSTQTSTTGDYPITILVYTPTANGYLVSDPKSDPNAAFSFTENLVVNDTLIGTKNFAQSLSNPAFKPLYVSDITGDLKNGGFIEGTTQSGIISITKNSLVITSSPSLQLEFSGSNSPNFNFYGGSVATPTTTITSIASMVTDPMPLAFISTPLFTSLIQKPNILVNNLSDLQFSTHFSYSLNGKPVLYNSDTIGKTGGYHGTAANLGTQVGIKIIGPVASKIVNAIVSGQFAGGVSIYNGISRADIRNNMNKSVALAIRNLSVSSVGNAITDVAVLPVGASINGIKRDFSTNSSLLYLEANGGNVTLGNGVANVKISGKRTLVVRGADLYIRSNMYYDAADKSSILGVIVQKDANGNGGNLYIDPKVTNIVGSYVTDGSIMSSSDGLTPVGFSDINTLKNQLHIYGSITSENTIGGSRMSPQKCPSFLSVSCATVEEAQKYDLNYLRRYYLYNNDPFGNAKVIGGGTCTAGSCSGFDTNLIKKFTLTSESLAAYPVIVEYNSNISGNVPPVFDTSFD